MHTRNLSFSADRYISHELGQQDFSYMSFRDLVQFFKITFSTFIALHQRLETWAVCKLLSMLLGIFWLCHKVNLFPFLTVDFFPLRESVVENGSGRQNFARNQYVRRKHDKYS